MIVDGRLDIHNFGCQQAMRATREIVEFSKLFTNDLDTLF